MRETVQRPVLNPAFKRFQYLPHLPGAGAAKHACAAPAMGQSRSGLELDGGRSGKSQRGTLSSSGEGTRTEPQPPGCEFESPI